MTALLSGAGFGLGLVLVARGLWPPRPSLAVSLERLRASADGAARPSHGVAPPQALGARFATALDRSGLRLASTHRDLAILGRPTERFFVDKVLFATLGVALLPSVVAVLSLAGVHVPVVLPAWASVGLGLGGFFLPDVLVRGEAAERRRSFRHALGAFLDLVAVHLAGGAGIEAALHDAAAVGRSWSFARLREALANARLAGDTPWQAMGRLGDELGVMELCELGSNLTLAGSEGAKVRDSLAAKAVSLRRHEAAQAETRAQEASER
ncbi:MAG: type II secretion system F family protein, partial [Actinomycetota bacterium]|nr:type II secretion system F family protein [Actinomycetota bacterium]